MEYKEQVCAVLYKFYWITIYQLVHDSGYILFEIYVYSVWAIIF